jgi:SAM-dependent methyltransferase
MTVLDLGAGRGWAAKQFALRGCQAVALDITSDENVGLGRAWTLMKRAGVYFAPIIADGERLPLVPDSFDLVFCAATLHHTSDLPLFIKNIQRVLKPGGMLCAIGEPCIAVDQKAERILARDAGSELKHGINEQRPNLLEYGAALNSAGFGETNFIWPPGYRLSMLELTNCAKDLGAMHPAWSEHGWRVNLKRWGFYSYHRVASLPKRRAVHALPTLRDERRRLMRDILLWVSGEVQIFAWKR